MGLMSNLFRGDAALEACLIRDSAHILEGARGPHVAKIQRALATLDGARIAPSEAALSTYGRTTAAAVLAYKRARAIINRSYQQQADNIVGKMTIAALDREMVAVEGRPKRHCCGDRVTGGTIGARAAAVTDGPVRIGQPQHPATLSVLFQLVRVKGQLGPHAVELANELTPRANQLLQPFGMKVVRLAGLTVSFPFKVKYGETDEFVGLRKAAEQEMPGFKKALRVLVCPFRNDDTGAPDTVNNAASFDEKGFDRFVVVNAHLLRADRGTLLHEMVHCSHASLMSNDVPPHDPNDSGSIFSRDANRTRLRPEHAEFLQKAFFSSAGT
jgi:hypothetical protein